MPSLKEGGKSGCPRGYSKGVRRRVWAWGRSREPSRNSDRNPRQLVVCFCAGSRLLSGTLCTIGCTILSGEIRQISHWKLRELGQAWAGYARPVFLCSLNTANARRSWIF